VAQNCRFAFAVHVLSVLAFQEERERVEGSRVGEGRAFGAMTSDELAHTVNTNPVVIRRLLLDLRAGGLVETQRGRGGGAALARPSDQINMAQVYNAVAGQVELFGAHPNPPAQCCPVGREIMGVLEGIAARAREAVEQEYRSVTLADVVRSLHA
jgi:Rrf2 family protein